MKDVRKLQRSGKTYYLYLPDAWIGKNKLKPGSLIQLSENQGSLMLNVFDNNIKRNLKETNITLQTINPRDFTRLVTGLYIAGYDKFKIKVTKPFDDNELKRYEKWLKRIDVELLDIANNHATFFCGIRTDNVFEILNNMSQRLINQARSLKYNKKKNATDHYIRINKNHLLLIRSINQALDDYSYMSKLNLNSRDCVFIYDVSHILRAISKLLNKYYNLKKDRNYLTRLLKFLQLIPVIINDQGNSRLIDKLNNFLNDLEPNVVEVEEEIELADINDYGDLFRAKIFSNVRKLYRKIFDNYIILNSLP